MKKVSLLFKTEEEANRYLAAVQFMRECPGEFNGFLLASRTMMATRILVSKRTTKARKP